MSGICERHSDEGKARVCAFPDSPPNQCHQCGKITDSPAPEGLSNAAMTCSDACDKAWNALHPSYWVPIEDTLPGGRYDGVWEDSGFSLAPREDER